MGIVLFQLVFYCVLLKQITIANNILYHSLSLQVKLNCIGR